MNRPLKGKWMPVMVAGLLFSFLLCSWSLGEEKGEAPAPDASDPRSAPRAAPPWEPVPAPQPKPTLMVALDTVVAMANGQAITLDDLQRNSNPILVSVRPTVPPDRWPAVKERILKAQLENLIDAKLILIEARELGARIRDSRVQDFIMSLGELRMSHDGDLAKYLVAKGLTYGQLFRQVEEHLLFKGMIRQRVVPRVRVSPADVRRYYQRNIHKFTEEAAIHCFAISILKRENPEDAAAALTRAREALTKINGGAYFPDVAREYSEDPRYAEKGGDWGWITPGALEKKAADAAFALRAGEYSGIVEGDAAHWILRVEEKRDRSVIPLSAAWKEIELDLRARQRDEEIRRWGQRLRLKATVTYPVPLSEIVRDLKGRS